MKTVEFIPDQGILFALEAQVGRVIHFRQTECERLGCRCRDVSTFGPALPKRYPSCMDVQFKRRCWDAGLGPLRR